MLSIYSLLGIFLVVCVAVVVGLVGHYFYTMREYFKIADMLKRFSSKDAKCHEKDDNGMCVKYGIKSYPFASCKELTDHLKECGSLIRKLVEDVQDKQKVEDKLVKTIKSRNVDEALKDIKSMQDVEVWARTRVETIAEALYCIKRNDDPLEKESVREALVKMTELFKTLFRGKVQSCDEFRKISNEVRDTFPKETERRETVDVFEKHIKEQSSALEVAEETPYPMEDYGIENYMRLQEHKYCN